MKCVSKANWKRGLRSDREVPYGALLAILSVVGLPVVFAVAMLCI